jgi:hypothetical protein
MKYKSHVLISGLCAIGVWGIYLYTVSTCPVPVTLYPSSPVIENPALPPVQNEANPPQVENPQLPVANSKEACVALGGTFEETYRECGGISEKQCTDIGGNFVGCGSACRHNPNAEVCTMQCVIYCQL